eukprot:6703-Heterococcus_DN1.PRE.3
MHSVNSARFGSSIGGTVAAVIALEHAIALRAPHPEQLERSAQLVHSAMQVSTKSLDRQVTVASARPMPNALRR